MKYQDKKIISSSRAVKILFLSFTCEDIGEDIGVAMVLANYKRASRF